MNREIKFRGKSLESGKWVYGYFYTIQNKEYYILEPCALGVIHTQVVPESVGQFVGLKDCNGKEICENDVVEVDNEYPVFTQCVWDDGRFWLKDNCGGAWTRQLYHQPERLKVIGNNFEKVKYHPIKNKEK